MRVILIAGNFHRILNEHIEGVVNANQLAHSDVVTFLSDGISEPDLFLYSDSGIPKDLNIFMDSIKNVINYIKENNYESKITIMTSNIELLKLSYLPEVEVKYFFGNRVPFEEYKKYVNNMTGKKIQPENKKWINKFFNTPETEKNTYTSEISSGISRVIAITGHRGSGVTSTVVNLAETVIKEQLSVIIVDLDYKMRGLNMYYSSLSNSDDEEVKSSLIKLLAKPHEYEHSTYKIKPGFYVSTLTYSFSDKQLMDKFITTEKITTMISVLRNKFNLCILDLPMEIAMIHSGVLMQVDSFGLCVKNNLYSVLNTARCMELWKDNEARKMFAVKTKVIVSDYDDKILYDGENFTPNKTLDLLKIVSPDFQLTSTLGGYIPHTDEFNSQIETEVSIINSNNLIKESYKKILIKFLEGVG